jgi:hypothetical protein
MAFSTPSVRETTWTEIAPVAAADPAANMLADLIVEATTEVGTADATSWENIAANAPPDTANPR